MGKTYRRLTEDEILQLKSQSCLADDWNHVAVAEEFTTEFVHHTRFSGEVKLRFPLGLYLAGRNQETFRAEACHLAQCNCGRQLLH